MDEDLVYLGAKRLLARMKWELLAGQPPDGCDHLPVVEIKAEIRETKGSYNAYKPDLVAYKENVVMIVECKPTENRGDIIKLRSILADDARIEIFYSELCQRNIFARKNIDMDLELFKRNLIGAIAHNGVPRKIEGLYVLYIASDDKNSRIIEPLNENSD